MLLRWVIRARPLALSLLSWTASTLSMYRRGSEKKTQVSNCIFIRAAPVVLHFRCVRRAEQDLDKTIVCGGSGLEVKDAFSRLAEIDPACHVHISANSTKQNDLNRNSYEHWPTASWGK